MNYYQWKTDYQLFRESFVNAYEKELSNRGHVAKRNKIQIPSYEEYLPHRKAELEAGGTPTHRLFAESIWRKFGEPYYNIHPRMVEKLCGIDMTKIPSSLLQMPNDADCVNICFAQKHEEFAIDVDMPTEIVARLSNTTGVAPAGSFVHSFLMNKIDELLVIVTDFDVYTPRYHQPVYCMFAMRLQEDVSLQAAIDGSKSNFKDKSYYKMIDNLLKVAVSIGFLSDDPNICQPDVLNKDKVAFQNSDEERRKVIAERARRRGKNGYNVGTDMVFETSERERSPGGTGRELDYSHIRLGHPHLIRYGKGKQNVKMKWIKPIRVRPDKPFKSKP